MKTFKFAMLSVMFTIAAVTIHGQIKNLKTDSVKVAGNCDMCKHNIEHAANRKKAASAVWNKNTKILVLSYDSVKTNKSAILKRVAYAGYDNELFLAPDAAYKKLDGCCQYTRMNATAATNGATAAKPDTTKTAAVVVTDPLADVYTAYFALKDALTKDDGTAAAGKAAMLFKAIDAVDMSKLSAAQHTTWMMYKDKLSYDAEHIKGVTELEHQREHFISLSKNMYEVMKVIKPATEIYYDFCPMANDGKGANWLSKDKAIANPYFGKMMYSCGRVQETIK